MANQPYKQCPRCSTATNLSTMQCQQCGHQFRSVFTQTDQTQVFGTPPTPYQQPSYGGIPNMQYQPVLEQKSKVAAALFAFFLGGFGAHGFYLGNQSMGLTCLLVCVGSWIVMFLSFILSFLVLPILFLFLSGMVLSVMHIVFLIQAIVFIASNDFEFQRKYVIEKRWF